MIQGDGFFVVQHGQRAALHPRRRLQLRRRAGEPGRTPSGKRVQGYARRRRRPHRRRWSTSRCDPAARRRPSPPGVELTSYRSAATARCAASSPTACSASSASSPIADFANPTGLEKVGETAFRASANSGDPELGVPGEGRRGILMGGTAGDVERRPRRRVHQPDPRPARLPGQLARDHDLRPGARGPRQHQALTHSRPHGPADRAPGRARARPGVVRCTACGPPVSSGHRRSRADRVHRRTTDGPRYAPAQGWCTHDHAHPTLAERSFALNSDLIERVDSTPDTVITLVDGTKYVVAES